MIVLAAAEIGVGLAIVLQLYRLRASVAVDEVPLTEPTEPAECRTAGGRVSAVCSGRCCPAVPLVAGSARPAAAAGADDGAAGGDRARRAAVALGVAGAAGALALAGRAAGHGRRSGGDRDHLGRLRRAARSPSASGWTAPPRCVAVAVTVVALAVQVYSIGYLRRGPHDDVDVDHRYPPYAAQISLFTAAMLLVVVVR